MRRGCLPCHASRPGVSHFDRADGELLTVRRGGFAGRRDSHRWCFPPRISQLSTGGKAVCLDQWGRKVHNRVVAACPVGSSRRCIPIFSCLLCFEQCTTLVFPSCPGVSFECFCECRSANGGIPRLINLPRSRKCDVMAIWYGSFGRTESALPGQ